MAAFAAAGAAANLAGNLGPHDPVPWYVHASTLTWALIPVPVLFALGILAAQAFRQTCSEDIDPKAVREGLAWAAGQVRLEQQRMLERQRKPGRREPTSWAGRRLAYAWDWIVARPPPPPPRNPRIARATDATGICFSGGGIRSAAFNLGALQELQAAGELYEADYLSAVSGGSYMAGAYALTASCSEPGALASAPPFAPGTPEEQYLRNRTTYLVPNLSGAGVVMWRLIRGLAVNLAFVGLVLYLVARPYGWAMHGRLQVLCPEGKLGRCTSVPSLFHETGTAGVVLLVLVALALGAGLVDLLLRPRGTASAAAETWSLRLAMLALAVALGAFVLPWATAWILSMGTDTSLLEAPGKTAGFGALSTLATGFFALASRSGMKGSVRERAQSVSGLMTKARNSARKVGDGTLRILLIVVGGIVGPVIFLAGIMAAASGAMDSGFSLDELALWLLLFTVFVLVELVSDANRWSLQPYYKRRLQSAFGLVRQSKDDQTWASEIDFHTRLGFTSLVNVPELIVCAAVNLEDYGLLPPGRPVSTFTFSGEQIDAGILGQVPTRTFGALLGPEYGRDFTVPAAQGASGAAFSPAMGKLTNYSARFLFALLNLRLGVWLPNPRHVARWAATQSPATVPDVTEPPATKLAGLESAHDKAVRALGEARRKAEESRAAFLQQAQGLKDESLENHLAEASRVQAGLQTEVFAACLDVEHRRKAIEDAWYAPASAASATFTGFPYFPRPTRLFRELFGVFRSTSRFVYVTDGGHYECLGLLELLRRGCKWIYCFDASGDKTDAFNTIGDAVAIARAELGVRIELDPAKLAPKDNGGFNQGLYTCGKVLYPGNEQDPAHIVFVKLGLTEDVPSDVLAWHQANPRFPADGTGDQLYTDQRFEAYRALGAFSTCGAIEAMRNLRGESPLGAPGPLRPPAPAAGARAHPGPGAGPPPVAEPVTTPDQPPVTSNSRA